MDITHSDITHSEAEISEIIHYHTRGNDRHVHFQLDQNKVILRGHVNSYFQKQLLQESIRKISDDCEITNQLEVIS